MLNRDVSALNAIKNHTPPFLHKRYKKVIHHFIPNIATLFLYSVDSTSY